MDILALTNQELETYLTREYQENPLLECASGNCGDMIGSLEKIYEKGVSYQDHYLSWDGSGAYTAEEISRRGDVRQRENRQIEEQVLFQLDADDFTATEWEAIRYLTHCLDEKGFFPYDISEIASVSGFAEETIRHCLTILRTLEPAGIFSADIGECLIRQLEVKGLGEETLFQMIRGCMPDLLQGKLANVTRKLGISTAKVREYVRLIGTLNPRPIMNITGDDIQYIIPDVLVTREENRWQITLNDRWMGEHRLDAYYLGMMKDTKDPELKEYFRERLQRAQFLIDAVERRRRTLVQISEVVLQTQEAYFLQEGALRPMTLEDVAERIRMHPSTVSRAIRGKYIEYKYAVPMKSLFVAASGSNDLPAEIIRKAIAGIVDGEDNKKPFSDSKIAMLLQERGINVPRRTIAKYRGQLGIPDSRQRVRL